MLTLGWKSSSALKSACGSSQGHKFGFQHPVSWFKRAYNFNQGYAALFWLLWVLLPPPQTKIKKKMTMS